MRVPRYTSYSFRPTAPLGPRSESGMTRNEAGKTGTEPGMTMEE